MKIIGLMSGTSVDGVDAALCEFDDAGQIHLLDTLFRPYAQSLKNKIHLLCNTDHPAAEEITVADRELVDQFSAVVSDLLLKASLKPVDITAIGSHGQTIRHCPDCPEPFSLQIGNAADLAKATGIACVGDFRSADIKAGGQGAPLAPAFHNAVFRSPARNRIILNIGGIANISYLPANDDAPIIGFDTGPGNTLMDSWTRQNLSKDFDRDGEWAATGTIIPELLQQMLDEPYLLNPPPKSTGRELFSENWLASQLQNFKNTQAPADIAASLCEFTARTIADAIAAFASEASEIYACGGGVHNTLLMRRIRTHVGDRTLSSTNAVGMNPDWIEAAAFAWLARQTLKQLPGNLPDVTGARHPVVLGTIYPVPA